MGPMWCGKTNLLIESVDRARAAQSPFTNVAVVKHAIDLRNPSAIVARTGLSLPATICTSTLMQDVPLQAHSLYAIDEAQFFQSTDLLGFVGAALSQDGSVVLVSGLDLDFARRPFGGVLDLARTALCGTNASLSTSEVFIQRLAARCTRGSPDAPCGRQAPFSQRMQAGGSATVRVGGGEFYQPACDNHHVCTPVTTEVWHSSV